MPPRAPEQLYQSQELQNGFNKITYILDKIPVELKIDSFISLANYLQKLFENNAAQKDVPRKTLFFVDGISRTAQKERNENIFILNYAF